MSTASTEQKNSRIVFLDYLRIFAFSSVLIGHKFINQIQALAGDATPHATGRALFGSLVPFVYGGGAGVVVFFLVSGYIITHVLQTERTIEFLVKRIFRIYPLYIIAVLAQYLLLSGSGSTPSLGILLQQLSLMGDFFDTPLALNGVEWTLRIEVLFYLFMATMRSCGLITTYRRALPLFLILAIFLCQAVAPIPSGGLPTKGYLTIYAPFLLLGSMFYLYDKKQTGLTPLIVVTCLTFHHYFSLIAAYQPAWLNQHFAGLAFLLFLTCFLFRTRMSAPWWVLILSDMTYSIYLFHNWLFDEFKKALSDGGVTTLNPDLQALVALLIACFLMMRFIEKPFIRLGRAVLIKSRVR